MKVNDKWVDTFYLVLTYWLFPSGKCNVDGANHLQSLVNADIRV